MSHMQWLNIVGYNKFKSELFVKIKQMLIALRRKMISDKLDTFISFSTTRKLKSVLCTVNDGHCRFKKRLD